MMNNCVQLLEKAENLKKELTHTRRNGLNGDGEATSNRAALQDLYRQLLITNLEYALDKKIEQELWNFVFKNHITTLQQQTKDKSNPRRTEVQNQLTVFLDASSGFYAQLLQDLCHIFKINLPCRVRTSKLSLLKDSDNIKRSSITQPERPSCQYMCQHCLVHLGDIARYRNQNGQAESYYRHAAQLVPSNGQPYNQLAILAAAGGDILSTAFYYCRSLAVKCPFPGSGTNLQRQLSKIIDGEEPRHQKISTSELVKFYLKFHACIYLRKYESKLDGMINRLLGYIRAHLRAGSLSRRQLVHMAFLNLFSLNHLSQPLTAESGGRQALTGEPGLLENGIGDGDEVPWNMLVSFTIRMLGALLTCIPALSDDSDDLEHPALPAAKLMVDWLCENPFVLQSPRVTACYKVWQRFAKVLNALGNQDKANNMDGRPLPEDLEVRGFVGLKDSLSKLDFVGGYDSVIPDDMQHPCRCFRLYQLGLCIATKAEALLCSTEESDGTVFSCELTTEAPSETDEEDAIVADKPERASPTGAAENGRAPRHQSTGTTSILASADRTSGGKKQNNGDGGKKERTRIANSSAQNLADSKLKSIQEEDSHHHDDHTRSSTASSLDSSCSSPNTVPTDPPTHHKQTHHVTFAPMPPRHSASPDHGTMYGRRSPSPDISSMALHRESNSPEDEQHVGLSHYHEGHHGHHQPQGVQAGVYHPRITQPNPIQIGVYQRHYHPYPNVPYQMQQGPRSMPQQIQPAVGLRSQQLHSGAQPPPNPADLPKPLFPPQRMAFPNEPGSMASYPSAHRSVPDMSSAAALMSGSVDGADPLSMYSRSADAGSNLARMAHLQQQQLAQAHMMNNAAMQGVNQPSIIRMPPSRPSQMPPALGLAARFQNPSAGMPFPPSMGQSKPPQHQIDSGMGQDSNFEAYLTQQRLKQQAMSQLSYQSSLAQQLRQDGGMSQVMAQQAVSGSYPRSEAAASPYQYGQPPRNLFGISQSHVSPSGSNSASTTSSPTPAAVVGLGSNGPLSSNTSPQAGSLPAQGPRGQSLVSAGPALARFSNQLEFEGHPPGSLLSQMMSRHPKAGQPPYLNSPTQGAPGLFGQDSASDLYHGGAEGVGTARGPAFADIIGMSPKSLQSSGMAGFGVGPIRQSPSNHSPSDPFPPNPLSQERQQIYDESLDMLEGRSGNAPSQTMMAQRQAVISAGDLPGAGGRIDRQKQLRDLLAKDEDESYKLFPDTGSAWSIGRDNRNDNSLGLSNLGSIGSERAMAQQSHGMPSLDRYMPWGGGNLPEAQAVKAVAGSGQPPRGLPQPPPARGEAQYGGNDYQSLWSAPMMPSGPSALEQLIRQQQQHAGQDKTPP